MQADADSTPPEVHARTRSDRPSAGSSVSLPAPAGVAAQLQAWLLAHDTLAWRVLISALLACVYWGAGELGFLLASGTKQVTAVWPPTGIALVAMLLLGTRALLGVALGAVIVNATNDEPLLAAVGIALGNTAGPWLAQLALLRLTHLDPTLARVRDVVGLVAFGAIGGMAVTATNGVFWLAVVGIVPWPAYLSVWWVWWVGDAMGVLILSPFMLSWLTQPLARFPGLRWLELVGLFTALVVLNRMLFFNTLQLTYAVFPFAVWAALRFGQRATTSATLVIAAAAVWGLIHDRGPFSLGTQDQQLTFLVLFLGVMAITVLLLAAAISERQQVELLLQRAHDDLERRVERRTSELERANQTLKQTNGELGRSSRELAAKNEEVEAFVYVVSHDLRAPLVNLRGFSEELRTSCRELEQRLEAGPVPRALELDVARIVKDGIEEPLRYIATSSTKLQRLIDALLVLSRTGRQEYQLERLNVSALVHSSIDVLRQTIAHSGATVHVYDLPDANGDLTAIGQVFGNLLGNALKYLQPGRPGLVEIGGEQQGSFCHYWVRDNGAGISASAQQRIFQVFQRFHPQLASGDGMGLAIVKRVVDRHGGKAWVESEESVGTTFHVTLPNATFQRESSWRKTA